MSPWDSTSSSGLFPPPRPSYAWLSTFYPIVSTSTYHPVPAVAIQTTIQTTTASTPFCVASTFSLSDGHPDFNVNPPLCGPTRSRHCTRYRSPPPYTTVSVESEPPVVPATPTHPHRTRSQQRGPTPAPTAGRARPYHAPACHSGAPPPPPPTDIRFWRVDQSYGWLAPEYQASFRAKVRESGGDAFASVEQYVQARKALAFDDERTFRRILQAGADVEHIWVLGREVEGVDSQVWARMHYHVLVEGYKLMFRQNGELERRLLRTRDKLVYAHPNDGTWGIGYTWYDAPANTNLWGRNLLGRALEEVRSGLRRRRWVSSCFVSARWR
ncbi:DUF1768-domain-containing protein [Artomyces pyxidatus]|uniref:DUF1768-domain-containing protein n=1 Tax=Artomyces pyxidatus TaxID=48021 RepID=A0ACB8SYR5_9AGAM|nr:DUF1768-domain-containing protein [Artomyces pyxidatus]